MATFAGIVAFHGGSDDPQVDALLRAAIAPPHRDRAQLRRLGGAVFVQGFAAAPGAAPSCDANGRQLFAASARLDNRAELQEALGIAPAMAGAVSDEQLILRVMERWGADAIARCLGAFAFALWDDEARRLTLGRDCLGGRPLFFHRGADFVAFASTLPALLALPGVPRAIDEVTLANFMIVNVKETRRTFYRGIERVPSRTVVTHDASAVTHRHYWMPDLEAPAPFRRDEDYIERTRELLDQAVAASIAGTPDVAISISGGLDSSAVAATVARLDPTRRIACFSVVLPPGTQIDVGPGHYADERDKVEALGRMYPALDVHCLAPETLHPIERDDTRHFAHGGMPTLAPSILGTHGFLRDAVVSGGYGALLTGNLGNYGLSWAGRFSLLELLRAGAPAAFLRELRAVSRHSGRSPARTFAGDVVLPAVPAPVRRAIARLRGRKADGSAISRALNPGFIADLDLPRLWRAQGFDPWFGVSGSHGRRHRSHQVFDSNQFARDANATSAEVSGYDIRDPLGDRRLAEFLLRVPEPMYRRDGVPRSFARAVLADRLPREILAETRRGAQAVTWYRRLDARRQDIAADLERLEASPLACRMIDLPHLKQLMARWPADEQAAVPRRTDYAITLSRGLHIGRFIRWVETGSA